MVLRPEMSASIAVRLATGPMSAVAEAEIAEVRAETGVATDTDAIAEAEVDLPTTLGGREGAEADPPTEMTDAQLN